MANHRFRLALLVSGLRWRAGTSLVMFAVAVIGVGARSFGSIYLHSMDQSILNSVLRNAPIGNTGLTLELGSPGGSSARLQDAAATVHQPRSAK